MNIIKQKYTIELMNAIYSNTNIFEVFTEYYEDMLITGDCTLSASLVEDSVNAVMDVFPLYEDWLKLRRPNKLPK